MINDISKWKIDYNLSVGGTREKFWLINPSSGERCLFKLPKEDAIGEIWAETVASEVGKTLNLEMMDVSIVRYRGRDGTLLKNFVEYGKEEFFDGGDLLKTVIDDFDTNNLQGYTINNIITSLIPLNLEREMVKVIIFDALIANQDRHCENWGVIQREGLVRFAPIFDNGASLGFNYNEDQVQLLVNDKRRFEAFTNRGNSIIGINQRKRPKVKELLSKVNFMFPVIVEEEIARLKGLQYDNKAYIRINTSLYYV